MNQLDKDVFTARPWNGDYPPFMDTYVSKVPEGDIIATLRTQIDQMSELFGNLTDSAASYRYAPGKWSLKQVIGHVVDTERIFVYRALRIARGDETPLLGYDENKFVEGANFDKRSLADLLSEFVMCRKATVAFFATLDTRSWSRTGIANNFNYTVRAIAFVIAGHVEHHRRVVLERYIPHVKKA